MPHLGLQRIMIPGSQVSALTTGNISLAGAGRSTQGAGYLTMIASTAIQKLDFSTDSLSTLTAVTTDNVESGYISNSGVAGYNLGGWISPNMQSYIRKFTYATESYGSAAGSLSINLNPSVAFSNNGVAGYGAGGTPYDTVNYYNYVQRMPYSTETGSATNTMPSGLAFGAGASNSGTAGYSFCGSNSSTATSTVYKMLYSTDSWSTLSNTTAFGRGGTAFSNNGVAAYLGSFWNQAATTVTNALYKLLYSTDTNSTISATLAVATRQAYTMSNNGYSGYISGGYNSGGYSGGTYLSTIQKLNYATETRSTMSPTTSGAGSGPSYANCGAF